MVQPSLCINGLVFAINTWFKLAQSALRSPDLRYMDLGVLRLTKRRNVSRRCELAGMGPRDATFDALLFYCASFIKLLFNINYISIAQFLLNFY